MATVITKIFDLVFSAFSVVWDLLSSIYTLFMACFNSFKSVFDDLFASLGIYDVIIQGLQTLTNLANNISSLVHQTNLVGTILSFCAFDTLFTVVITTVTSTFGVILSMVAFLFVTIIPALLSFLAVKGVLRLIRLFTGGIAKP